MGENIKGTLGYIELLKSHESEYKAKLKVDKTTKFDKRILIGIAVIVFMSFVLMGIHYSAKLNSRFLIYASLFLLSLSYVLLLLIPIVKVWQGRRAIHYFFTMPLSSSVDQNISGQSLIDSDYIPRLVSLGKETLELGMLEVKHERESLNKRIALLVGPIDKLGLLPGIVSMVVTIYKPTGAPDWAMGLAYGYIGLVVLSISFINVLVKYDRIIALTELALSRCKSKE